MGDVGDSPPYQEYDSNEQDNVNEDGSPREVQHNDPHTPSRLNSGSLTSRVLSAAASAFGISSKQPATASKQAGDEEQGRSPFDHSPIHPSASATPMMSGSVGEGTPGADQVRTVS